MRSLTSMVEFIDACRLFLTIQKNDDHRSINDFLESLIPEECKKLRSLYRIFSKSSTVGTVHATCKCILLTVDNFSDKIKGVIRMSLKMNVFTSVFDMYNPRYMSYAVKYFQELGFTVTTAETKSTYDCNMDIVVKVTIEWI